MTFWQAFFTPLVVALVVVIVVSSWPIVKAHPVRCAVAALLLVTAWLTAGCARAITAPSPDPRAMTTVLVRVLSFTGHGPLAGADVLVNTVVRGHTNSAGEVTVPVPIDADIDIGVRLAGYHGFSDAGRVAGPGECWTFYLEGA